MCWKCGKDNLQTSVSRNDECPDCHADLHSCKNCTFYAPGSHYDCHETIDELVKDKEKSNFCDSFKLKKSFSASSANVDKTAAAKKAFESLFS